MRLHFLQHVHFEGLGSIETWAQKSCPQVSCTRLFENETLPGLDDFDWLIVMGGPMNIYEDKLYPWLTKEKYFISKAIGNGKHVLGICLGAQLIADALGAKVHANEHKEIGWFPIHVARQASREIQNLIPDKLEVLHWHGDTFDLPDGSRLLASSGPCQHQGFTYNDQKVIALQFHLETTRQSLEALITHCGNEIIKAPYIQNPEEMLKDDSRFRHINRTMDKILDYWAR